MLPNLDRRRLFPGLTTAPCIGIAGFILQTDTNEKEQDHAAIFNLARRKMNALVYRGWVLLPSRKACGLGQRSSLFGCAFLTAVSMQCSGRGELTAHSLPGGLCNSFPVTSPGGMQSNCLSWKQSIRPLATVFSSSNPCGIFFLSAMIPDLIAAHKATRK